MRSVRKGEMTPAEASPLRNQFQVPIIPPRLMLKSPHHSSRLHSLATPIGFNR
jgi:hypothetical protein